MGKRNLGFLILCLLVPMCIGAPALGHVHQLLGTNASAWPPMDGSNLPSQYGTQTPFEDKAKHSDRLNVDVCRCWSYAHADECYRRQIHSDLSLQKILDDQDLSTSRAFRDIGLEAFSISTLYDQLLERNFSTSPPFEYPQWLTELTLFKFGGLSDIPPVSTLIVGDPLLDWKRAGCSERTFAFSATEGFGITAVNGTTTFPVGLSGGGSGGGGSGGEGAPRLRHNATESIAPNDPLNPLPYKAVPAIPEASTWIMTILGFATVAFLSLRRSVWRTPGSTRVREPETAADFSVPMPLA